MRKQHNLVPTLREHCVNDTKEKNMSTNLTPFAEELVTNTHGRQYWIYKDDVFYQQRIANAGPYQKKNLIRLRDLKPNARTIIDVGANIGMNSIEYGTWGKTVHSFEPTPQTFSMLERTVALAKQQGSTAKGWYPDAASPTGFADTAVIADIHCHQVALSSSPGTSKIIIKKDNAGHNYLDNLHLPTRTGQIRTRPTEPPTIEVELRTLDSYGFEDVDIIKVDVEGHEFDVVQGAEQTILKYLPVVQLEMVEHQPIRFNWSCQQIYDWFYERDFVPTLSTGKPAGRLWHKFPREMERFFVHKSLLQPHQDPLSSLFEGFAEDDREEEMDRPYWTYEAPARVPKEDARPTTTGPEQVHMNYKKKVSLEDQ
jgi:FkbM family methyltransferase